MSPSVEVQMQIDGGGLDIVMSQMVLDVGDGMATIVHVNGPAVTKAMDGIDVFKPLWRNGLFEILFAQTLYYTGNPEDAIALGEQALRLCPNCPAWYSAVLGKSYRAAGRYQDAIRVFKEVLVRARKGEFPLWLPNANLAITYAMMGGICQ